MKALVFSVIIMSLVLSSCSNVCTNTKKGDETNRCKADSIIISESDSIRLYQIDLPSADEYVPGSTEIWYENKVSRKKRLIVKSNPECYGRIVTNSYYNPVYYKYPIDSIPTISNCVLEPNRESIIVEGPTCDAGEIATFRIALNTGTCYVFPSNNGFIGFSNWSDNVIVSSKYNDVDYDLVLWYEVFYIIDAEGHIVNVTDSKDHVIEEAIPIINQEAGLRIDNVRLLHHNKLIPQFKDDSFWGNKFEYNYPKFDISTINTLDSLVKSDSGWARREYGYKYFDVDFEYGMFVTIEIDKRTHMGVITKGAFGNRRNAPRNKK